MMTLFLLLALLALSASVAILIAASPPLRLLALVFGSWAERCRGGAELAD